MGRWHQAQPCPRPRTLSPGGGMGVSGGMHPQSCPGLAPLPQMLPQLRWGWETTSPSLPLPLPHPGSPLLLLLISLRKL